MNTKRLIQSGVLAVLFLTLAVSLAFAQAPSTAFTYQGQLKSEGQPYTGACDFQFGLYDDPSGGTSLGNLSLTEIPLTEGFFTVHLDFGADVFTGEPRYLDISVRCPAGTGDYTQLQPRQELTPAPYALYATAAKAAETSIYAASADAVPWTGISGMPAGFADGIDNDTTYAAGSGLTLSDTTFSVNTTTIQSRVTGVCGEGYAMKTINADGTVICEPVGTGDITAVSAGFGLTGGGTSGDISLATDPAILQQRVSGTCSAGSSIRAVNQDGTVTCEADDNTTYTAGLGLTLTGTSFAVDTSSVQSRVTGVCGEGFAIRQVTAEGNVVCQPVGGTNFWFLTGNGGTTPGTNYLGTSDNQALEIKVNSQRVFRFEPNTTSPNLIGGYSGNTITTGVYGATISGGGESGYLNSITDVYGSIGGGAGNLAGNANSDNLDAKFATVAGGDSNTATAIASTIGGGQVNTASGYYSTVGGGKYNTASAAFATISGGGPFVVTDPNTGNKATDDYCTIGGGANNQAGNADTDLTNMPYATVAGGHINTASGGFSAIGGGSENTASGNVSAIGGGVFNTASGNISSIGGGYYNIASGPSSAIGGGDQNTANGYDSAIGGGYYNAASADFATVSGGESNTASGQYSTVPGGYENTASGEYSFAAGNQARATTDGSFVWADAQNEKFYDRGVNTFNVRAKNGAFINSGTTAHAGLNVYNGIFGSVAGEGTAILGSCLSDHGYGLAGWNYQNGVGVGAWSLNGNLIEAYDGGFMGESYVRFYVDNAGNVRYDGASVPYVAIPSPTGGAPSYVSLYGLAAAEAWYEDLGSSSLVSGKVNVSIDPLFAQTVTLSEDYQVQVTATCNEPVLLYVSEKTTTYFTVQGVRLDGKPSNCAFDYRISAKAMGYETVRLEAVDIPEPANSDGEE